jgi:hypothetical protein
VNANHTVIILDMLYMAFCRMRMFCVVVFINRSYPFLEYLLLFQRQPTADRTAVRTFVKAEAGREI